MPASSYNVQVTYRLLRVPLGDYVRRGLFARVEYWADFLGPCWDRCFRAAQERGPAAAAEGLIAAKVELDESARRLREACLAGTDPPLREACTALTQVYTAYHPSPELGWLGCPPGWGPSCMLFTSSSTKAIRLPRAPP